METPRRSYAPTGAAGAAATSTSTSRFPGIGGAPAAGAVGLFDATGPPRAGAARTDDELHFERWKETVRAQDEEQALLHQTVVASKRQQLDVQHERLAKQRAFIRHEKRKILLQNALLESEKERFDASLTSDWFTLAAFPTVHDRRVTLDVGGQLFEVSSHVLRRDPTSMLAALIDDDAPLSTIECGCFRIDRDAWLFRYVLHFLRDGLLPPDPKLLRALYLESEFWKIDSLRKTIELKNMELLQIKQDNDGKTAAAAATALLAHQHHGNKYHLDSALLTKMKASSLLPEAHGKSGASSSDPHAWWLEAPTWWGGGGNKEKKEPKLASLAATAMKRAQLDELDKAKTPDDKEIDAWWKATTYKGKDFASGLDRHRLRAEDDGSGTPRTPLVLSSTWPSTSATH